MKRLRADDLLGDAPPPPLRSAIKRESRESTVYMNGGSVNPRIKKEAQDEPLDEDYTLDTDDLPREYEYHSVESIHLHPGLKYFFNPLAHSVIDTSAINIEDDDDMDLQLALHRSKKLQKLGPSSTEDKVSALQSTKVHY